MHRTPAVRPFLLLLSSLVLAPALVAQVDDASKQLARDIFKELIGINTTDSVGNTTTASEAMAKRLRDAGFSQDDVVVLGPNERKKNLVARLRGTGAKKPVLLIGHLDVVEAKREDWTTDPFQFVEKDGFFYGRGTQDMKNGDAIMVNTLIRLKKEGYKPERDIILALTADEEGGDFNGVDWLLKNHRDLVDAEFVLNHDTNVSTENGKLLAFNVDATEKLYADYQLEVTNPGGHSSIPIPDNAIYHLANGLARLARYQFPFELNTVTRAYYEGMSKVESGQTAADMKAILKKPPDRAAIARLSKDRIENSTMRTTCVATMLNGGHARNALPQRAQANVNCRILPGHTSEEVRQTLVKVLADPKISVRWFDREGKLQEHGSDRQSYPPPKLLPEVFKPLGQVVNAMWPGVPVVPDMSTGASDGVYTNAAGLPTYAIGGTAVDRDDVRAHGKDERLGEESFYRGADFYYRFLKAVTSP
jgi:acetylornithine deacetylase/succinyl-diaminopimelate desuccinylase-like protein